MNGNPTLHFAFWTRMNEGEADPTQRVPAGKQAPPTRGGGLCLPGHAQNGSFLGFQASETFRAGVPWPSAHGFLAMCPGGVESGLREHSSLLRSTQSWRECLGPPPQELVKFSLFWTVRICAGVNIKTKNIEKELKD